ncbi:MULTISPECIES: prepilin-type N-terminal cleavage/methylation domain-containing protein [Paenibacillus]|uniref:prepilin-type N-terminal cleavage/methylation domain-containing protein n=1 Tax=Paenibacillus TaxID=44249 RepID=UPI000C7A239B|nr:MULTISPECIES: prepilin-type N-terminal cleavage/methylation domain-containing protein [Paenibacillus]QGG54215.1 prepilin-type N-terminal cleavage/methylation domain-containing protein [Paenibacillus sp. B01]
MTAILKKLKKDEKGFTLIELLAVIVILGIIAAIAIPVISNIMNKSRDKSDIATAQQIYDAARMYVSTELNGDFKGKDIKIVGGTGDTLVSKNYLDAGLRLPSTKAVITGGEVKFKADGTLDSVTISTDEAATTEDKVYQAADLK